MTALAWHMIALGLLFWASSSAERNKNVNEATDGSNSIEEDKQYDQSKLSEFSQKPKISSGREAFAIHEKTLIPDSKSSEDTYDLNFSILPSESAIVPSAQVDQQSKSNHSQLTNSYNTASIRRVERNVEDLVDLKEPKNDLELETRRLTNDMILETAHEISGYNNYYNQIKPTRTKFPSDAAVELSKSDMMYLTNSGEEERASSRGRSLPLTKPDSAKSDINNVTTHQDPMARSNPDDRKTNSDIQDIINGFVKLLNGNVQVQVNTNGPLGKPNFPSRTRINNRGPPRITDLPPIIFDPPVEEPHTLPPTPAQTNPPQTVRDPPPYPFDLPLSLPPQPSTVLRPYVAGVPLPEQIVPMNSTHSNEIPVKNNDVKESAKPEKPFVFNSPNSYIEKVNRTQTKVTNNATFTSTSPSPLEPAAKPLNDTKLTKPIESQEKNDTKSDAKVNKPPVSLPTGNQTTIKSSSVEIKPSSTTVNLKSSAPPNLKPEVSDSFLPSTGVGTAVVLLEPSTQEVPSQDVHKATTTSLLSSSSPAFSSSVPINSAGIRKRPGQPGQPDGGGYFPRPGIVLDDPEYKPGAHRRPPPIITSPPAKATQNRDVFDVTVSAIQGPGANDNSSKAGHPYVFPVDIEAAQVDVGHNDVITNPQAGQDFVSIDGKRTYLNLFDSTPAVTGHISPTLVKNHPLAPAGSSYSPANASTSKTVPTKSPLPVWKKPTHPPVRIDTCIVGDDSTCEVKWHEMCRIEVGVSSCHCRPGYARRKPREPCLHVVSLFLSLRVDRMYDLHLSWSDKYTDNDTSEYQQLEYEAGKAIDSALSMTPFSDLFLGSRVNNMYTTRNSNIASPVFVNMTIQLAESHETLRTSVKQDIQKHLMGVIQRRSNNVGASALWVDSPSGVVSQIHDVDECTDPELNDCHSAGKCTNVFGSFHCTCPEGYRDPMAGDNHSSGRTCEACNAGYCNHRGECSFLNGQPICKCSGSYYGAQCEIDGEVLGVAVGSSLVAILIIITTLACLCAWSRRWNKEQKIGSPIFGYMPSGASTVKTPVMGAPPYQVSLEDRLRWAQIADAMAHANHYGPEPVNGPTRPSSTIFGYTLPHSAGPVIMPRLRPPSVHTLRTPESSTSEEEDRADLLGRNFQVPRPKSRSSVANQSGIYYDVDYESQQQSGEIFSTMKSGQPCIPLNTYTMGSRSHYFNFRS
ncbi:uncharacterized protein pwn isoform X2 [Planococcus citri]|uniref:uncharacterized protein pwn isoform X2 n=1 Tax=Planococcus citri TaxID=170843 RepID=UPI0031F72920